MENFSTVLSSTIPSGTYFSKGHTWVRKNIYGLIKIGLDKYIIESMNNPGISLLAGMNENIKRGDAIFKLIKGTNKLVLPSPVTCKIKFINPGISWKSITDPFEDDWIVLALSPEFIVEKNDLLNCRKYEQWIYSEINKTYKH